MSMSRSLARITAGLMLAALAGCGGGGGGDDGGGGGGDSPLSYSGNTNPAVVTTGNAASLTGNVMGSGNASGGVSGLLAGTAVPEANGLVDLGRRLNRSVRGTLLQPGRASSGQRSTAAIPVDATEPCDSGSVRTAGTLNDNGTGTLSVSYNDCRSGDDTLSGPATMRVDAFDLVNLFATDYTISFSRLTLRGSGGSTDLAGSLRSQVRIPTNTETITENVIALNNNTGHMTKSENLVFVDVYNNIFFPSSYVESISGRIFDKVHGFVDITTSVPFVFGTLTQVFPNSGQMLLTGAANARIRSTAFSPTLVTLALDLNGDNVFERVATLNWTDLSGPAGADLADGDNDGMHNSWELAKGLNPFDSSDAALDSDGDGASNRAEYRAGTDPNNPGFVPPLVQVIILPGNSDLIFDSGTQKIYASVRGNPGSILPIDPATGDMGPGIPVGIDPVKLARSDNGQYLYVGLGGEPAVQRIDLASQMVNLQFSLGSDAFFGPFFVEDMQVLPGNPQSIGVSLINKGISPRHAGVAIFDNGIRRAAVTAGHTGSNVIEFSASAGTLYGYNNETTEFGFRRMAVDPSGVSVLDVFDSFMGDLISGFGTDIKFGGGLIYTTTGRIIDPVARTVVGTLPLDATFGNLLMPDAATGRVFAVTRDVSSGTWSIRAFDVNTRQLLGSEDLPGVMGNPGGLIRWGAKGLAFRTSDGQIFLIESSRLIP